MLVEQDNLLFKYHSSILRYFDRAGAAAQIDGGWWYADRGMIPHLKCFLKRKHFPR